MVITCGDCGSNFRLDVALLKGAKGVRVRCRSCGGYIVVLSPEKSPAPPVAGVSDVVRSEPASSPVPPPQETSPPPAVEEAVTDASPQEPTAFEADISDVIRPEPEKRTPDKMQVRSGPKREVSSGGRSHMLKYFIIAGLSILLLAAGTLFDGTTKSGRERLGKFFPGWGSMRPGSVAENTTYDIRDVKWSYEKQTASGSLFVIKGKVANFGKGPSGGIGIRATLLGKDNQALVEKMAFAGNFLDEASLRRMDRSGIAGAMSNRFGAGNGNKEIPPGKALPFMVVFFDPPGGIEAVMVKAMDAR